MTTSTTTTAFRSNMLVPNNHNPQEEENVIVDATFVLKFLSPNNNNDYNNDDFEKSATSTKATIDSSTDSSWSVTSDGSLNRKSLQHTLVSFKNKKELGKLLLLGETLISRRRARQRFPFLLQNVDSSTTPLSETQRRPYIVGHRGCPYYELENTREGFVKSAEMGVDAVELDVFLLKCGTLIVFHGGDKKDNDPGHLIDYCKVDRGILEVTYTEALQLTFNPDFKEFGCPARTTLRGSIPTLEQVLGDAKESGVHVKIELKGPGTVEPTLEVVERLDMMSQCSYASFDKDRIAHFRSLRPDKLKYPTGLLFNDVPQDYLQLAEQVGATEIHLRYDTCTKDRIDKVSEAGFGSLAWLRGPVGMASDCQERFWDVGNEDESMYDALLRTGVQQICTNRPDVLVQYRQQLLNSNDDETYVVSSQPFGNQTPNNYYYG
jgi:glycerophosphoryl diester phosphodiesterase